MSVGARVLILLLAGLLGTALPAHARDGTLGFRCHAPQCDIRGDVLRLIELRKSAASFREVLEIGDRLVGGAGLPPVPPRVKETRPPSAGAIRRVVAKCGSTSNDAEVSAWLRARALDASAIDSTWRSAKDCAAESMEGPLRVGGYFLRILSMALPLASSSTSLSR